MKLVNVSIKRFMVGGVTAAAMILPFALPSAALASRGSRDVRGNLPVHAEHLVSNQAMGYQQTPASHQFRGYQYSVETSQGHQYTVSPNSPLSVAQQAMNPSMNSTKPMNIN
jgi:hypothetical protein